MGLNEDGQLGHSSEAQFVPVPQEIVLPEPVTQVAAGHHHTLFLTESGNVWACGRNNRGQLGLGSKAGSFATSPQRLEALSGANISSSRLWFWNKDESYPRLVQSVTEKVAGISCGHMHSGCIDANGMVYTWGYGSYWQLGTGQTLDVGMPHKVDRLHGATQLAMGGAHTLVLRQTDDVVAWGANQSGVLGMGIGVSQDARLPTRVPKLSCSQVSTGWKHSAAVGHAGELYSWGWGGSVGTATSFETGQSSGGQLGLGNEFDYWKPTQLKFAESGWQRSSGRFSSLFVEAKSAVVLTALYRVHALNPYRNFRQPTDRMIVGFILVLLAIAGGVAMFAYICRVRQFALRSQYLQRTAAARRTGIVDMPSYPAPLVQLRPVATHTPAAEDEGTVRECPICFEEITQNQEWLLLPCKHGVCATCYQKLIQDQHQVHDVPTYIHPTGQQLASVPPVRELILLCGTVSPEIVDRTWCTIFGRHLIYLQDVNRPVLDARGACQCAVQYLFHVTRPVSGAQ
ncbi:hypothetical protein WJX82_006934 [Trebouxia sp. C0006]